MDTKEKIRERTLESIKDLCDFVRERLQYTHNSLELVQKKFCTDDQAHRVDRYLDFINRTITGNNFSSPQNNLGAKQGKVYLDEAKRQMNQFKEEILEISEHLNDAVTESNLQTKRKALNKASNFFSQFTQLKDRLFVCECIAPMEVVKTSENSLLDLQKIDYSIIYYPIGATVNEIANIAESSIKSIDMHIKKIAEREIEEVKSMNYYKQVRLANATVWAQLLFIIVAALSLFNEKILQGLSRLINFFA